VEWVVAEWAAAVAKIRGIECPLWVKSGHCSALYLAMGPWQWPLSVAH
jgi:hypothetical protein